LRRIILWSVVESGAGKPFLKRQGRFRDSVSGHRTLGIEDVALKQMDDQKAASRRQRFAVAKTQ
jgi:hypothetical protein